MKLPIVEAMMTAKTGNVVPLTRHISFVSDVKSPISESMFPDRAYELLTEAKLAVYQHATDDRAIAILHDRARHMVMHELYGPVQDRLYQILHLIWEQRQFDDKIVLAVEELINDLRP